MKPNLEFTCASPKWSVYLGILGVFLFQTFSFAGEADSSDLGSQDENNQEESSPPWSHQLMEFASRDYLLGDWGGRRSQLSEKGVDLEMMYYAAVPSVINGGMKYGTIYQGLFAGLIDVDTEKLMNWEGGHLHLGLLSLHGEKPFSDSYIGDLNKVSLIDFPNAFKLWELWYERKLFEERLSLKLGVMSIDQDFFIPQYSQVFVNQTFYFPTLAFNVWPIPGLPPSHHALASTPYGALGARLKYQFNDRFYAQAGVYDGNPDTSSSFTGFDLSEQEGALAYFETGISYELPTPDAGLPGTLKLAGYYHTGDFQDVNDAVLTLSGLTGGFAEPYGGNYGLLLLLDQQLYRETLEEDPAGQGLGSFFRLGFAPKDRNLTQFEIDGGLVYKGPFPTRDWDSLAVGVSYLEMSDDIRSAQQLVNSFAPGAFQPVDFEGLIEITYKAQVTAWWTLQPSLQWVFHPGGSKTNEDAVAFVLLSTLRL